MNMSFCSEQMFTLDRMGDTIQSDARYFEFRI